MQASSCHLNRTDSSLEQAGFLPISVLLFISENQLIMYDVTNYKCYFNLMNSITKILYILHYNFTFKKKEKVSTFLEHFTNTNILFFLQIFIKEVANNENKSQMDEITNLNPTNQRTLEQTGESQHGLLLGSNHREIDIAPSASELKPAKNGKTYDASKTAKAFETQVSPSGKMLTSVKSISKRKISQQKEKKATQMLAIVLGKQRFYLCSQCLQ